MEAGIFRNLWSYPGWVSCGRSKSLGGCSDSEPLWVSKALGWLHMDGNKLKFESWKLRIHTRTACQTQSHFYCFLKYLLIPKSGCGLKGPIHGCQGPIPLWGSVGLDWPATFCGGGGGGEGEWSGNVVQLLECLTGMLLMQDWFPSVARDFSTRELSVQMLQWCLWPPPQRDLHASTSVRTFKDTVVHVRVRWITETL